jgi:hypothetical protein
VCGGQAVGPMLRRRRQAFGADDFDIGDAEEAENVAQMGFLEIATAVLVEAAAAAATITCLPASRPLGPVSV